MRRRLFWWAGLCACASLVSAGCPIMQGTPVTGIVPLPIYVEKTQEHAFELNPNDSALARLVAAHLTLSPDPVRHVSAIGWFGAALTTYDLQEVNGEKVYTEHGAWGPANWPTCRFVVRDGCAEMQGCPEPDWAVPSSLLKYLTRDGTLFTPALVPSNTEYVVVSVHQANLAGDCWPDDDSWHEQHTWTAVYEAQGSLDNVQVPAADDGTNPPETVNVTKGDHVEVRATMETIYRIVPSPEAMGYTEQNAD